MQKLVSVLAAALLGLLWVQSAAAQTTVSISGPSGAVDEGDSVTLTVTLSAANADSAVTVPYTLSGTGITAADVFGDIGIGSSRSVVIPSGDTSASFNLYILIDGAAEAAETLTVTLGTPTVTSGTAPSLAASPGDAHDISINASTDTTGPVTVAAGTNAAGGTPGQTATFTITRSGAYPSASWVSWAVVPGGSSGALPVREWMFDYYAENLGASLAVAPSCIGDSDCEGQGGLSTYPKGQIRIGPGDDQTATVEVQIANFNILANGHNAQYRLRLLRTVNLTEAGALPPLPHAYYTSTTRPADAAGTIAVPDVPGILTVQRPAPASDDPAGRPELRTFQLDLGRTDIPLSRGGGTYTLREEPTRAERRRAQVVLDSYHSFSLASARAGRAALFAIDLCPAGGCGPGRPPLRGNGNVNFDFRIGGTNGGVDVDYLRPINDSGAGVSFVSSSGNWRTTIPLGSQGVLIIVPLVDDSVAEMDETLHLELVGNPWVSHSLGSVSLSTGLGARSLDFTILGEEPVTEASPAGSVTVSHSSGEARRGFRRTFTFTLTDDDAAAGDTQTGADADYRIWFTVHFSDGFRARDNGDRLWSVLADGETSFFYPTTADARNPFLSIRDEIQPSAGRYLQRNVGLLGNTESPIPAVGYGYVVIRQGQTTATLPVLTESTGRASAHMAVALFAADAVDANGLPAPNTPLPAVDFTAYSFESSSALIADGHNTSPAWIESHSSGFSNGGVAEASTHTYRFNFRGNAPSGGASATNPVEVTWRILGVNRHGDARIVRPAHPNDIGVTGVTLGTGVAFVGNAGSSGVDTITSTPIGQVFSLSGAGAPIVLAEQTLRVTSWESNGSAMFSVAFGVRDDDRSEPDEAFLFQVTTNRPTEVGEIPGRGAFIEASDAASVRPRAIRGTNMDGDNTSPRSWEEAPPSDNNNPLRFRLEFPADGPRPERDAAIAWEVRSELHSLSSAASVATRDDFLQCLNEDCTQTQLALTLPSGRTRISASEAAKQTGPWYIWLPFTLNADGQAEPAETFIITAPSGAVHSGVNLARVTDMAGSNTPDGLPLGVVTIAASTADTARLAVGIGNADCSGSTANCEVIPAGNIMSGVGAVAAATGFVRTATGGQAALRAAARSDTVVGFPITFHTAAGPVSQANVPRLSVDSGSVTIGVTVGGTLLTNGAPADSGAALSAYENTWHITFSRTQVLNSWQRNPRIYVPLPLASVTSAETLTASITEVSGNGGAVSQTAATEGQVSVQPVGGYFTLSTDGGAGVANEVAEEGSDPVYTVTYTGLNPIPAGGVTLDWSVVATTDTPATAADFGTGAETLLPEGDNAISFAAGMANGASQTFSVSIFDDAIGEAAETFRVAIGDLRSSGGSTGSLFIQRASVTTTISVSDVHSFRLSCPAQVAESIGNLGCQVIYTGPGLTGGGTVDWGVTTPDSSYTASGEDFGTGTDMSLPQAGGGAIQFPAGAQSGAMQAIPLSIFDDSTEEAAERFVLSISNPVVTGVADAFTFLPEEGRSLGITILASDAMLSVTCTAASGLGDLTEGAATTVANCQQTTGSALSADVQVHYTLYDGHGVNSASAISAATQATDFATNMGTLTLPAGTASGVDVALEITATDDNAAEPAENFSLVVSHAVGDSYVRSDINHYQDLTVAASVSGDVLQFGIALASSVTDVDAVAAGTQVNENVGTLAFTVSLTPSSGTPPAPANAVTVDWAASGVDTAADLSGYPATRTLTFTPANYQTPQTVTLTVADDGVNEALETLTITLGNSSSPPINAPAAEVQIADNDTLTFTVARRTPASGAIEEGGSQVFSITPSGGTIASGTTVRVPWAVGADTDTATVDAAAGDFRATGQASDTTALASFPSSGATPLSFTGNAAQNVTIWTLDDAATESQETFVLTLGAITGADGATATAGSPQAAQIASSDITADTADIILSVSGPDAVVSEGSEASFTVSLANQAGAATAATGALQLTYSVEVSDSQNAAAGVDANSDTAPDIVLLDANGADAANTGVSGMASGSITIAGGATMAVIRLRVNFDGLDEDGTDADNPLPAETVTLTLTRVSGAAGLPIVADAPDNAHSVDIRNVDAARTLSVSAPQRVMEGGTIEFEIEIAGAAPTEEFSVAWTLESDGAQLPAASASGLARNHGGTHAPDDPDITPPGGSPTGSVTFSVGSTSQMVSVPVRQDPLNEGDEALRLRITAPAAGAGGRPTGFPTTAPATQVSVDVGRTLIPASDEIQLALVRPEGQSGAQNAGGNFNFAVSFGCADGTSVAAGDCEPVVPTTAVTIPYTYMVGSQSFNGMLTVAAGQTADALNAAATGGTPVVPPPAAMTAITGSTTVQTVTVDFGTPMVTPPVSAPAGASPPAARAITPAEQMALERDAEEARREGRNVPQTVATAQVQVGAFSASLSAQRIEAPEGSTAQITVTISGASGATLGTELRIPWSVDLTVPTSAPAGSAAASAADFMGGTLPSGTLVFPATAGDGATQTIEIVIATDSEDETDGEYFQVRFGTITGAGMVAVDTTPAVVLIPSLSATLSVADPPPTPEGTDAVFMLDLSAITGGSATTRPVTVHYILVDVTARRGDRAVQGADFVAPLRGSVEIPAGETRAEIRIPVLQDGVLEPVETFQLRFTGTADGMPPAGGGRFTGGGGSIVFTEEEGTATVEIRDDVDQANRRTQRVAAMVAVLDRQTAELATDAITERFDRSAMSAGAQTASLSLAGRSLIGGNAAPGAGAPGANANGANDLGLALFGAAGLGSGAGLGVAGAGGAGASGDGAFGGLGAGLAGGANMWRGQDLPSLAEVLRGSSFSFSAVGWSDFTNIADGLEIWGRGGASDLKGDLSGSNGSLRYKGDSISVFVGADRPVREDMLAGLAVGYSAGDLRFTDTAVTTQGRFELSGELDSNMLSLHPYFNWWITPEVNTWLTLGYGMGSVDLEEVDAGRTRTLPGTADATMWMVAAGVSGRVQLASATQLKLSFELSRVGSEVDAATFDDGARMNDVRARTLRAGGEVELSHGFALPGGFALRPFASGRVRFQSGGKPAVLGVGNRDAAFDVGGGVSASQPAWGLDAQLSFSGQLNSADQEEQRLSLDLSYDLGGDKQGLTMSVQTQLSERRSGISSAAQRSGIVLPEFGSAPNSLGLGSGSFGALSGGTGTVQQSITGEIGYGVSFRQLGRAGLLTPYGRFDLRQSSSRWAAGLRLAETGGLSLGLESGLDMRSGIGAAAREFDLLLTGQMRF